MFKGIYNEGEFYTDFYFENKLSGDLLLKVAAFANLKERTDKFKSLDAAYWMMRDSKKNKKESILDFYSKLLPILAFDFKAEKNHTLKEASITSFSKVTKNSIPEFIFFMTDGQEEGMFESLPLNEKFGIQTFDFIADDKHESKEDIAETRDYSSIISEYFDELENPPKWIILGAPTAFFLCERNKWSRGQYLKFNLDEIFQQKNDDLYASILALVSKDSLCPEAGSSIHEEIDDNSHRQAHEVTTELRESVRESIELLINEMIHQKKEAHESYLKKGSEHYAKELSHDALFYVYRLIFLLYLESQGEDSDLLPLKSEIYRHGYSLEKLLELIHDIPDEKTKDYEGSFVHESLEQVFSLIFNGFDYKVEADLLNQEIISNTGFLLKGIKSDLFNPETIKHLKGIKLRNGVLLQILHKLSLSTVGKGRNKKLTRVSYSNLGINQLGAVYEGLLSYSGFFASEELHALKPTSVKQSDLDSGKEQDQIYLAPKSLVEKYKNTKEKKYKLTNDNLVLDENGNPKIYKKGSFIYRLAGRDRQKLASFYTPESLTKCTVKYSLKVLFENKKTLDDLWKVKILEPAMGSGAFLNEAVNQLSDKILELEIQQKVKELKTPKEKQKRLYEIKYELITHNVYGVDLNPTAIELARFSLWLNCIGAGKEPPQFEGKLKIGNSLIGARFKKGVDGIYPWLLLDDGMMNYGKRLKDYDAEGFEKIQSFRREYLNSKLDTTNQKILQLQKKAEGVLKELIESNDPEKKKAAYERLKLCGDLWCSAFFLTADDLLAYPKKHETLCSVFESILESGTIDPKLKKIVEEKYLNERFFHWELEYPEIIASGGFDLILGNPPWLAIEWQDSLYVSDVNPVPVALELNAANTRLFVDTLNDSNVSKLLKEEYVKLEGYSNLLDSEFYFPLKGSSKNTYKAFDVVCFNYLNKNGAFGVIQEDGILEDKTSSKMREILFKRFCFHFQFQNEKLLFSEVLHGKKFSVNVFGELKNNQEFYHVGNLFLPSTVDECFCSKSEDSLFIKDDKGQWETRGNQNRLIFVQKDSLALFSSLLGGEENPRFINFHTKKILEGFRKFSSTSRLISNYLEKDGFVTSDMIHETNGQENGMIGFNESGDLASNEVVLSGPNIFSNNVLYAAPKVGERNKNKYEKNDLVNIGRNYKINSIYRAIDTELIDQSFPRLNSVPFRKNYRIITRGMIHPGNERMIFACILPPGPSFINGIKGMATRDHYKLIVIQGFLQSLLYDAFVRAKGVSNLYSNDLVEFNISKNEMYFNSIARRVVRLNFLTSEYDEILRNVIIKINDREDCTSYFKWEINSTSWDSNIPVLDDTSRIFIECELEALVALSFNISSIEVCSIIETYLSVLSKKDRERSFQRTEHIQNAYNVFEKRGW